MRDRRQMLAGSGGGAGSMWSPWLLGAGCHAGVSGVSGGPASISRLTGDRGVVAAARTWLMDALGGWPGGAERQDSWS
jgi:hypothetical protein